MIQRPWLHVVCLAVAVIAIPVVVQGDPGVPDRSPAFDYSSASFAPEQAGGGEPDQPEESVRAELTKPSKGSDDWEFTLSPYLWLMSIRADVDAGPASTTAKACFTDLLKDLDGAAQLRFEGVKDRWGFYLDGTWMALSVDERARIGPFKIRGLDVDVDFTQAWLDFGGMIRFGEPGRVFDFMLGGRYTHLSTDVSVGPFIDISETNDYVSPVIGGRMQFDLGEKWLMSLKADASGFGVDDGPDLTWGITGIIGYRLSEKATMGLGYRYYDIDMNGDRLDLDLSYHGPIVGIAFQF